jgi:acyl-coenzyme A thioesterase PaaI-like protein
MPLIADRVYGTVNAATQKKMSRLEFVQGLAGRTVPLNTIAWTLRYSVIEVVNGRVVIVAEPDDNLLNPAGTKRGGFSATLLDSGMGLAILSTLDTGIGQTTLEFRIPLVRPITPETGRDRGGRRGAASGSAHGHRRMKHHGSQRALAGS